MVQLSVDIANHITSDRVRVPESKLKEWERKAVDLESQIQEMQQAHAQIIALLKSVSPEVGSDQLYNAVRSFTEKI